MSLVVETKNITAIHKATSYEDARKLCKEIQPDVVLLDMSLPENGSIDLCRTIKSENTKTAFIILSSEADIVIHWQFKALGVDFILDKYHEFDQVPVAINAIADRKK